MSQHVIHMQMSILDCITLVAISASDLCSKICLVYRNAKSSIFMGDFLCYMHEI